MEASYAQFCDFLVFGNVFSHVYNVNIDVLCMMDNICLCLWTYKEDNSLKQHIIIIISGGITFTLKQIYHVKAKFVFVF